MRALVHLAVHVFLWRDSQILLLRRANTGYMDGLYSVPAGHVEFGERAVAAAARELYEECCLEVQEQHLIFAGAVHRHTDGEPNDRIDLFYNCSNWVGAPQNGEPGRCEALLWASTNLLPVEIVPYIRAAILQSCNTAPWYIEFGWA